MLGIWVYFLVLFQLEEIVFRGVPMTGLGVVAGRTAALVVVADLVGAGAVLGLELRGRLAKLLTPAS